MRTALLGLALLVQVVLVPVVGMAGVGATEHARTYGGRWSGVLGALLGWSGVVVAIALWRALTGVGGGWLVLAAAPPVLAALMVLTSSEQALHGRSSPEGWLRRRAEELAAVALTAVPGALVLAATSA